MVKPIGEQSAPGGVTDGGVAGDVLRVTNLSADGSGSLRQALAAARPRLVVFEVGGVIDLRGRSLVVRHPHLTIAGQTAPDPGITLIRGGLVIETHDVIVQHLAVRPGDGGDPRPQAEWAPDALGVRRGSSPVHDVVFEHCSATWAVDENLSTSGPADADPEHDAGATAYDITLRNCLIGEALSRSTHPKGEHSKGTLVHDGVRNVVITGCLYAHNRERNPRLKGGTTAVVRDNVMYNWGSACAGMGAKGNRRMLRPAEAVLSGNLAVAGPDTRGKLFVKSVDPGARAFLQDNVALSATGTPLPLTDDGVIVLPQPPGWSAAVARSDAWKNAARVLRTAGARPARRDPVDARIVRSVIHGDGRIIDGQRDVGGYPLRAKSRRALVVPKEIDARRRWLERLSQELAEDATLGLAPLWSRFGVRQR